MKYSVRAFERYPVASAMRYEPSFRHDEAGNQTRMFKQRVDWPRLATAALPGLLSW